MKWLMTFVVFLIGAALGFEAVQGVSSAASLTPAVMGLLGVLIGSSITVLNARATERAKKKKEAAYLCIIVSCALDQYVNGCANVAADDGFADSYGCIEAQIESPTFETDRFDVEWKSLPVGLMYEVLEFPSRCVRANKLLGNVAEHSGPPYNEWIEERQMQYAALGIVAAQLSDKLRGHSGIHMQARSDDEWNPVECLCEQKAKIEARRVKRASRAVSAL